MHCIGRTLKGSKMHVTFLWSWLVMRLIFFIRRELSQSMPGTITLQLSKHGQDRTWFGRWILHISEGNLMLEGDKWEWRSNYQVKESVWKSLKQAHLSDTDTWESPVVTSWYTFPVTLGTAYSETSPKTLNDSWLHEEHDYGHPFSSYKCTLMKVLNQLVRVEIMMAECKAFDPSGLCWHWCLKNFLTRKFPDLR